MWNNFAKTVPEARHHFHVLREELHVTAYTYTALRKAVGSAYSRTHPEPEMWKCLDEKFKTDVYKECTEQGSKKVSETF